MGLLGEVEAAIARLESSANEEDMMLLETVGRISCRRWSSEAIEYLKSLQLQVQRIWMGSGMAVMMFPGGDEVEWNGVGCGDWDSGAGGALDWFSVNSDAIHCCGSGRRVMLSIGGGGRNGVLSVDFVYVVTDGVGAIFVVCRRWREEGFEKTLRRYAEGLSE
ncbi:hypothetical protein IFM89_036910 [Coptis chinensis]|uniref:Uncharacterized protein n=1 Tax=Coptis chinensis TaxID=261450 RepID=A0A835I039_9MAGN|nr:hypothetical protein IFM89_036910 [Coptis chinensis]